jgi:hypothetical protein
MMDNEKVVASQTRKTANDSVGADGKKREADRRVQYAVGSISLCLAKKFFAFMLYFFRSWMARR